MIYLVDVDSGNWRLKLEIEGSQKHYVAKKLYESFGFVEIDRDEDEIIMEMNFAMLTTNVAGCIIA